MATSVRQVLCIGDLGRLRFEALNQGYVLVPGYAPTLSVAEAMVNTAEAWRAWQGLVIDSRVGSDAEVAAFLQKHQAALTQAGTRLVIVLDALHVHLGPTFGRLGHVARVDDPLDSIALALGLPEKPRTRDCAHVVVLSAKGGTGKTSTAVAVAGYVPRVRPTVKVTLVDMDLFDGNVAQAFGVAEEARSIIELATVVSREGLTVPRLQEFLTPTPYGVDILAAPAKSTYRPGLIDPSLIAQTYDGLQALGRGLIVTDAPPDIRQSTPLAGVLFDPERKRRLICLLILGPRRFERDGFERMVDYLRGQNALDRAWLVYVQGRPFRREQDLDLIRRLPEIAREHGLRGVAGQLPYDFVVEDAEQAGVPFWQVAPRGLAQWLSWTVRGGSPFQRAAAQLARRVLDIAEEDSRG